MRRLISGLLIFGVVVLGVATIVSLFGTVHPLFDSLAHFRFHFLVLMMLILPLLALMRKWPWLIAATTVMVIGGFSLQVAGSPLVHTPNQGVRLKLVQFNTLFSNPNVDRSLQWIIAEKPDFVMLQEVSSRTIAIYDGLATDLPFCVFCKFATVGGIAVRSKFPIKNSNCRDGQGFGWAQVDVRGKDLTLSSLHLHWPYPYGQWEQLTKLDADFRAMPRPVVLTGDFNAAPWSAAVKKVAAATDTEVAQGLRFTLKMGAKFMKPIPFLPIDHVLLPDQVQLQRIATGPAIGSDHLPVVAEFVLK